MITKLNYRVLAAKGTDVATRKFVDLTVGSHAAALRVKDICTKHGYSAAIIPTASEPVSLLTEIPLL